MFQVPITLLQRQGTGQAISAGSFLAGCANNDGRRDYYASPSREPSVHSGYVAHRCRNNCCQTTAKTAPGRSYRGNISESAKDQRINEATLGSATINSKLRSFTVVYHEPCVLPLRLWQASCNCLAALGPSIMA